MSHNDPVGSITYEQEKLIAERNETNSTLFQDIEGRRIKVNDLSSAEAAKLITDLLVSDEDEPESPGAENADQRTAPASYSFVTEGTLTRILMPNNLAQEGVRDNRNFEGRRKCE